VPWARPGVGAVATQANVEVAHGPNGIELLASGLSSDQALARLVAGDPGAPDRQVALVDARGRVAAHTGEQCMAFAGHVLGDGVSCQANMMAAQTVWPAMLAAYEQRLRAGDSLTLRLLAALDAAEAEGGDVRGRQSAAILVVPAEGELWETLVSLRVEDDPEPLVELRRLVTLQSAYALAGAGDEAVGEGRFDDAARLFAEASAAAPGNAEMMFWAGLGAAQGGDIGGGAAQVRAAIEVHPGWRDLLERLEPEVAPAAAAVRAALATPGRSERPG
jgi:uncharacterized Ntn-hydrolase superfamily protein